VIMRKRIIWLYGMGLCGAVFGMLSLHAACQNHPAVIATSNQADDVVPSIISSLTGIGLKLSSGKGPVEVMIIDSAEPPSPN